MGSEMCIRDRTHTVTRPNSMSVHTSTFFKLRNGKPVLLVAKIVDDILMTGEKDDIDRFEHDFNATFKLGTGSSGPGSLRFFGLNIIQDSDTLSTIDGNDKLNALEPHALTRNRHRDQDDKLNDLERSSFMSLNSSLGWLGINLSLIHI